MAGDSDPPRSITAKQAYGPIQAGFRFDLAYGYQVVTGTNNAGKSSLLQLAFVQWLQERLGDHHDAALLLPDRSHIWGTNETGGRTLQNYNMELQNACQHRPFPFEQQFAPTRNELPRLLMSHTDYIQQVQALNGYLSTLGLPTFIVGPRFVMNFSDLAASVQGSGLRSLLTILAALTDPQLNLICVDEPELSLEPRIQRGLRDILMNEVQRRPSLTILAATHSHLFLNRRDPRSNFVLSNKDGTCTADRVSTREALYEITFNLLGNDTEDLFFPGNYLVTEGASDQVLCERVRTLLEIPPDKVKILSAGGITEVRNKISAVVSSLTPLVAHDSPYADRVVALIDQPSLADRHHRDRLEKDLGDRLYVLSEGSLEDYLSSSLYGKAHRDKSADHEELERLRIRGATQATRDLKRQISDDIARAMTVEDLDSVSAVRDAVLRAAHWGRS